MKNKPTRHKEVNTFKFQPFSERLGNIDANVVYRIGHGFEEQTAENESYFYQTVQKWNVLNLTESYDEFKKDLKPYQLVTLPQILHDKEHIVEVLLKHIRYKNVLSLQPLLELVVALCKDLQKEFYPFFEDFFNACIELLKTKDTDQLEWSFTCLAYMFKFLWRSLIKDISKVFVKLLPLLSDDVPEYINNFAAESFAFVARKVKNREGFLDLIVKTVKTENDGIVGCGKLLFEVIHGVNRQFHSCTEFVLPALLQSLRKNPQDSTVIFEILEEVLANVVQKIDLQKSEILWKTLLFELDSSCKIWENHNSEEKAQNIDQILKLIGQLVEYRDGKFLRYSMSYIQQLIQFAWSKFPKNILYTFTKIAVLLLLSRNIKLTQEQASSIIKIILSFTDKEILLYFVENVSACASFEALILPTFLKYCAEQNLEGECFRVLTKLVLKKTESFETGRKYKLDFRGYNKNMFDIAKKFVEIDTVNDIFDKLGNYLSALICTPHFVEVNMELRNILENNVSIICKTLDEGKTHDLNEEYTKKLLFILYLTLQSLINLSDKNFETENLEFLLDSIIPFSDNVNYICGLKILDLYLTAVKSSNQNIISMNTLTKINETLEKNFCSPYHEVRLITSHIYKLFEELPEFNQSPNEKWTIFTIIYKVESTQSQVHTYRDQLQHLEKLSYGKSQINLCLKTIFKSIPLQYLCGALYLNFQLLWEPIIKIIATHAQEGDINYFWSVFGPELKQVAKNVNHPKEITSAALESNSEVLNELYEENYKLDTKPDFKNYRILLWKALALFPEVAEAKTRDVSELVLQLVENELLMSNLDSELNSWNIKQLTDTEEIDKQNLNDGKNKTAKKAVGNLNLKNLIYHLTVLSKVRSPKSMYREQELYKLYYELLSHKNPQLQKIALDCIMTYKHKFLTRYQEHLYNLIDEKNFKNELASFRIDTENEAILPEHRKDLIPFVMRIVFSKMSAKTGLRTGGKSSGQFRRNLVVRFLAGCPENELLSFVQMAFKNYEGFVQEDVEVMVKAIAENVDLEKFVIPKKLQSSANLLNLIFENFCNSSGTILNRCLCKYLLVIGAILKGAFDKLAEVHAGYLPILRTIRSTCFKTLKQFFERVEDYPWLTSEINALFEIFIWPYLDKLEVEGIHSPTGLLKLFVVWGSNPKYFPLLVKLSNENSDNYVLTHVMKLYANEKSHFSVVTAITDIFEKMLTLQPNENDIATAVPVDNVQRIPEEMLNQVKVNEKLNYGSCILLPHVLIILGKIKNRLEKSKTLSLKQLYILYRISELVWEPSTCDSVLQLLLPITQKKCNASTSEDTIQQMLTTIRNLLLSVEDPSKHLKQISPLFGVVSCASGRKVLCNILESIAKKNESFNKSYVLINNLNAWDLKWVDQPDFQKRLDAFKDVQNMSKNNEVISADLGLLVIFNCYFMLSSEKDISLKDNAAECLKTLAPYLIKTTVNKERDYILDTLFSLVRGGLKKINDDTRNECILLLGCLARECPNAHVVLENLNQLTNKVDPEVDFFENITHLQLHRHPRALLKYCQIAKQQTSTLNPRTLTQFILPLATHYLCAEKYANKNSIIDAAIETIGTVSRILPWHHYEGLLKFYLSKLRSKTEYQRQLVRIVIAILDGFHFDLSKGDGQAVQVDDVKAEETVKEVKDGEVEKDMNTEENVYDGTEMVVGDEEDEEEDVKEEIKAYDKINVLCKSTANRVTRTIQIVILPQLHKSLAEMSPYEGSHKLNKKRKSAETEEVDLLRVPLSLAVVKLLQRLPKNILDSNLPGVFMKLCTFLKSHLDSVRRITRETLQKILITLGPDYLGVLLSAMVPLLTRGFQSHVLVFTVHGVLNCIKESYKPTDVDKILLTVLQLCKADLFGALAEEKEVAKIVGKVSEARSTKSYDTLKLLAQYVTDKCLLDLIYPIKEVLMSSHSYKMVYKAQECLRFIAQGLVDNKFLSTESLLMFAYGVASERIKELLPTEKVDHNNKEESKLLEKEKVDSFIIPKAAGRSGARTLVKTSTKTNAHILIEFGLRLCYIMLKRDMLKEDKYKPFVDPFIAVFKNCLSSRHVKLSTLTLNSLSWVMKYDLPSMKENVKDIVETIFGILHKYAAAGLDKGDNFDLVIAAFKAMSVLVRDVKYHTIDTEQLKVLLLYAEEDLHNFNRQSSAFGLLKAIIARKLSVKEIHATMHKVAELSILSELPHVRLQARQVLHQFVMEYPLGKKLDKYVSFYLSQLSFELTHGRESALEIIQSFINSFPMNILKEYSGTFFVTVGARVINDEVPECRKSAANCLKTMLARLLKSDRDPLFDMLILWFEDAKFTHRNLSAHLCGIMVTVEKLNFQSRLPKLMPAILSQFEIGNSAKPGKFVLLKQTVEVEESTEKLRDHHLFQVLQMLLKICANCPQFLKETDDVESLATHSQTLLAYPHDWVRFAAAQFLGYVLNATDVDHLSNLIVKNETSEGYLCNDPASAIKSLTLDLCAQLQPNNVKSDLAQQVIKNLVFVAKVLQSVETSNEQKIDLLWLTKRMRKIVNLEVVEASSSTILRTEVFKWIAAVATVLDVDKIKLVLYHLLAPLVREMITTEVSNAPLRQLSKQVGNLIKRRVGLELYSSMLAKLQQQLSVTRAERKRTKRQLAVTDPEAFAKKKIKWQEKKKEVRKRKIAEIKGTNKKKVKRRKVVELTSDEII